MWDRVTPPTWLHTGVVGAATADVGNTGVDDLTAGGDFNLAAATTYTVYIDGGDTESPNTFKWSNDAGVTWEREQIPIVAGGTVMLEHGLTVSFAAATGHDTGDLWTIACTGQVVSATALALGDVQATMGAEQLILSCDYAKGTETGLRLYATFPKNTASDAIQYRDARFLDIGGGGLLYYGEYAAIQATGAFQYPIDLRGRKYFKIYQIRDGSAAVSGTFTLSYELNAIRT